MLYQNQSDYFEDDLNIQEEEAYESYKEQEEVKQDANNDE